LCGSGELDWDVHRLYIAFTVDAMDRLYRANPYVRYVATFQNWLQPSGASVEHLHKQCVAIDEHGLQNETEIAQVRGNPNMYNEWAVDYAGHHNLIFAENDHAVAFAGFGHRHPTLEVFSKSSTVEPWLMADEERDAVADLVHACHIAAGPHTPSNEEWLHRPLDVDVPMPWRIVIKWRVTPLAGFEGGTKIHLNTISPGDLKRRVLASLLAAREEGRLAPGIRLGNEARWERNSLRYNPAIR
jgi:galactose-1-phosphate uridylyltransferase